MEKIEQLYKHCIENMNVELSTTKIGNMNVTKGQLNSLVEMLSKNDYDVLNGYDKNMVFNSIIVTRFRKGLNERLENIVKHCISNSNNIIDLYNVKGVFTNDVDIRVIRRRLAYLGYDTKRMSSAYGYNAYMISEYGKTF